MSAAEESNPFSTRWTRPGAVPYRFPAGDSGEQCVERLAAAGWRGQIVGPHGTGKSTLLAALQGALERAGRVVQRITLTQGQRWWRPRHDQVQSWNAQVVVVVDGFEQLTVWARWRLRIIVARRGAGLLVTAHQSVGLPLLATTAVDRELAQRIVADLQAGGPELVGPDDVAQRLAEREGNLRETLFDLYDLYELRRPRSK